MIFLKTWKINKLNKKLRSLRESRKLNQPKDEVLRKEVNLYLQLAAIYRSLIGNTKYPYAAQLMRETYRAAAYLDNAQANYILGKDFLEEAKLRQAVQSDGVLDNDINASLAVKFFEIAHAYLQAADELNHIQAKRLRGLCWINGWGVTPDQDKGFDMVVASIEKEGSWDKVPQIFAAIGLNKPEFFAKLMQKRK